MLANLNKYSLNDVVYVIEDEAYYMLIDAKHQNERDAWLRINHVNEELAAASGYNANDIVEYDGKVFLLYSHIGIQPLNNAS